MHNKFAPPELKVIDGFRQNVVNSQTNIEIQMFNQLQLNRIFFLASMALFHATNANGNCLDMTGGWKPQDAQASDRKVFITYASRPSTSHQGVSRHVFSIVTGSNNYSIGQNFIYSLQDSNCSWIRYEGNTQYEFKLTTTEGTFGNPTAVRYDVYFRDAGRVLTKLETTHMVRDPDAEQYFDECFIPISSHASYPNALDKYNWCVTLPRACVLPLAKMFKNPDGDALMINRIDNGCSEGIDAECVESVAKIRTFANLAQQAGVCRGTDRTCVLDTLESQPNISFQNLFEACAYEPTKKVVSSTCGCHFTPDPTGPAGVDIKATFLLKNGNIIEKYSSFSSPGYTASQRCREAPLAEVCPRLESEL